jgi:nickel/cobalt exporter
LAGTTLDALLLTAAFVGFFHTALGPDHFLPFIAMSRSGRWSLAKTMFVTAGCGIGHVASSVVLGLAGLAVGTMLARIMSIEEFRGEVAGWLLLGFGLAYMVWGLRQAWRRRPHAHVHVHADGTVHSHTHQHDTDHAHVHGAPDDVRRATPWILFLIFVFGPCEPLIPLLIAPAAASSLSASVLVAVVFGAVTLATMLSIVAAGYLGLSQLARGKFERFADAGCGAAIAACGVAVCLGM